MYVSRHTGSSEEGIRAPGAGVTGGHEQPDVSTGNQIQTLGRAARTPHH